METTDLFYEAMKESPTFTWKDIFGDSFRKHTRADREFAMQTGTLARRVPEDQMLQSWHRPWLWWDVAKFGVGLVALLYALRYFCYFFFGAVASSIVHLVMILPPLVAPVILMVLFWELNVPQNISFAELMLYFLAGGLLSFLITTVLFIPFPTSLPAYYAPLREEPAKLGAVLAILWYIERVKKQKIYGLTGVVVGAAVGAAFSGIESMSYAINLSQHQDIMIQVQIMRALLALAGHITYCLPYATAIALGCEDHKMTWQSILNPMTMGAFLFSVGLHAFWNGCESLVIQIGIEIGSVFLLLYWVRKALHDIVQQCTGKQSPKPDPVRVEAVKQQPVAKAKEITLYCNNTPLAGLQWKLTGNTAVIGRQRDKCLICYPGDTAGVSRVHCQVCWKDGKWFLQDLESTCGTYVNGRKLAPYERYPLNSGAHIFLGSKQVWITVR